MERVQRFVIDDEFGETIILVIDMISERSLCPGQLFELEGCLITFGENINFFDYFHIFIIESTFVLLDTQLVSGSVYVSFLVYCELFNYSSFFLDLMPDDVASSAL